MSEPVVGSPDYAPEVEWWAAAAAGRLQFQWCEPCARPQHPPRPVCGQCHDGGGLGWRDHDGRGRLHTFTTIHTTTYPDFADRVPYTVAVVRLPPHIYLTGGVRFDTPDELIETGAPVLVHLDEVDGQRRPMFELRAS